MRLSSKLVLTSPQDFPIVTPASAGGRPLIMKDHFPPHTKAEWLAKVEKDLRGKPLGSLDFTAAGTTMSPFWHQEDREQNYPAIVAPRAEPCKTGIALSVTNPGEANQIILDLLNKGANALLLYSETIDVVAEKETILQDVLLN